MKKTIGLIAVLLLISLVTVMAAYAQGDSVMVTNSETDSDAPGAEAIIIIDPSAIPAEQEQAVGAEESVPAEENMHVQWNEDANGTVEFPAGQQILIGMERELANLPPSYVSQMRLDNLDDSSTAETVVTLISGCIVVEISSDDTNTLVVEFLNEGETSVHIYPPPEPDEPPPEVAEVLVCVRGDGGAHVERVSGDGVIEIRSAGDTVVSDVVETSDVSSDGGVELTPSGVGAASS